jgi:hypothetical protein
MIEALTAALLAGFGAFRLGLLLSVETGPFAFAERLREATLQRYGADTWQYEGMTCPMCQSFWIAGILSGMLALSGFIPEPGLLLFIVWFGAAGLAYFLVHLAAKLEG